MIDGVLLLNKQSGPTSHDQVDFLRKIFNQKQIGHAGTLDPIAKGLLVILLGKATKLSNFLLNNDKRYEFSFLLGKETNTLDRTGQVLKQSSISHLLPSQIEEVLKNQAQGRIPLSVPLFSAVKVRGKKLYQYARKKDISFVKTTREDQKNTPPPPSSLQPVPVPPVRKMHFFDLKIKTIEPPLVSLELSCSKGAYIRSYVSYIGRLLGVGAYLEELTRLSSFPFKLKEAKGLQEIKEIANNCSNNKELFNLLKPSLYDFSKALPHIMPKNLNRVSERDVSKGLVSGALLSQFFEEQLEVNKKGEEKIFRLLRPSSTAGGDGEMRALVSLKPYQALKLLKVFR